MLGAARWTVVSALVAGWLLLPSAAFAIVPQVHDHGKFFKPETVKEADAILLKIQDKYKKDVVVETFPKIPDEIQKSYHEDKFFKPVIENPEQYPLYIVQNNGLIYLPDGRLCRMKQHQHPH